MEMNYWGIALTEEERDLILSLLEERVKDCAEAAFHDKKADGGAVTVTTVSAPGSYEMKTMPCWEVIALAKACLEGESL